MNIYKSSNKTISGVCAGFAEEIGMDAAIVRFFVTLLCLIWPYLAIVYFVLAIVMPDREGQGDSGAGQSAAPLLSPNRLMLLSTIAASMSCGLAISHFAFGVAATSSLTFGFLLMASGVSFIFDALTLRTPLVKSPRVYLGAVLLAGGLAASAVSFTSFTLNLGSMERTTQFMGPAIVLAVFVNLLFPSKRATTVIWLVLLMLIIGFSIYLAFLEN